MVYEGTNLWHAAEFNASGWLMIIIHGYRATILYILLNILCAEYPAVVTAKIVDININSLDGTSGKPLDMDLPPTPPVTFGTNLPPISAVSGSNALLPCNINNLGENMDVYWIKKIENDTEVNNILTAGVQTWTSDMRFKIIYNHDIQWTLRIKNVQPRDAGMYQCLASNDTSMSILVSLEVESAQLSTSPSPSTTKVLEKDSAMSMKTPPSPALLINLALLLIH